MDFLNDTLSFSTTDGREWNAGDHHIRLRKLVIVEDLTKICSAPVMDQEARVGTTPEYRYKTVVDLDAQQIRRGGKLP